MSIEHYIEFSGDGNEISKVVAALKELVVRQEYSFDRGSEKVHVTSLQAKNTGFAEFLTYVKEELSAISFSSEHDCTVWYIDSDSAQGNGELNANEIALIAEINASFCWTMFNSED